MLLCFPGTDQSTVKSKMKAKIQLIKNELQRHAMT